MTSPPGTTPTTQAVSASTSERCERDRDLSTRKAQMNFLVDELHVTHVQAHHLIVAYERDQRAPLPKSAQKSYSLSFLAWLMEQTPDAMLGIRNRKAARHGRDYRPRNERGELVTA